MFSKGKPHTEGEKKCAHPACFCTVPEGKKYCSERCHDSRGMTELNCQCHHEGCHPA